jgi:hypothetical protein
LSIFLCLFAIVNWQAARTRVTVGVEVAVVTNRTNGFLGY